MEASSEHYESKGKVVSRRIIIFIFFAIFSIFSVGLFSQIASVDPWMRFIGASAGAILCLCCISAIYLKAGFQAEKFGLKILDWLLIGLDLSMVGAFHWIGADPVYWFIFVLLPSLCVRAGVAYYVNNMPKRSVWYSDQARLQKKLDQLQNKETESH